MRIVADRNIPFVQACFAHLGKVELYSGREITAAVVADADALLVRSITKVNADLLRGSQVRFVATATIGLEHIDCEYLAEQGIGFSSAPGSNANSVAEYVVAGLLAVAEKHDIQLGGKSIGIVGVGNVGKRVALKCRALGMNTVLNDPPLARQSGDAQYRPLQALGDCDFVTLHTPLTFAGPDKTHHLADKAFFASLKPGAVFFNSSRGPVHDTDALKGAILSGHLRATVLDVWEKEPTIDTDLLRSVDLATPHIAGYSFDGKVAGLIMIYEALCRHLGQAPKHRREDFLPEPEVPRIEMFLSLDDVQQSLRKTVQQVYDIRQDDANTREILTVPPEERGACFDDLRKNYPRRREFQNTRVLIRDPQQPLGRILSGLGYELGLPEFRGKET
jgi:erythronate-4-phosphate dehydrogenase